MEPGQTSQVAIASLIIAIVGFLLAIAAGVYVMFYNKKDSDTSNKASGSLYPMPPARAMPSMSPPRPMPMIPQAPQPFPTAAQFMPPQAPMPPMPQLNGNGHVVTLSNAAPAPKIQPTIASGTVGSFFEDELPQM